MWSSLDWTSWFWLRSSNLESEYIGSLNVVVWRIGGVAAGLEIYVEQHQVKDYQENTLGLVSGLVDICHGVTLDTGLWTVDSQLLK